MRAINAMDQTACVRCGKPRNVANYSAKRRYSYCKACHAANMREWRKTHPMSAAQRFKDSARSSAGQNLRRGKIERKPCQSCGSGRAQMHHNDYTKPLEIEWLCRRCHLAEHREQARRAALIIFPLKRLQAVMRGHSATLDPARACRLPDRAEIGRLACGGPTSDPAADMPRPETSS